MSKNTLLSELINYISANASGNVVIAAPSSGYALDVTGTGRFTGALTGTSATFTNPLTIGNYDGQALKLQAATSTGSSYLRFYNSAATSRGYLGLFWSGSADYMVYDAGALQMNFNSSNSFTFTGGGTATFSGTVAINGSNALYLNNTDNTTTSAILNGGASGVGVMQFYQGGSERMRISGGNVGIGTTSLSSKLTVDGNDRVIELRGAGSGGNALLRYSDGATAKYSTGYNGGSYIIYDDANLSYRFVITSTYGKFINNLIVGDSTGGVSAPTNILMDGTYRTGGAAFDALKLYLYKSSTETYGIGLGDLADMQYWAGTTSTGTHRWFTSQTERMRITSAGKVAIGMTDSAYGTVAIKSNNTTAYMGLNVYALGNGNFTYMNHNNNVGIIGTEFGSGGTGHTDLTFQTGGGEKLRIQTSGVLNLLGNSTATSSADTFSLGVSSTSHCWIQTWGGRPLRINELGNNVYAYGSAGYGLIVTTSSDARIKKSIVSVTDGLSKVMALNGVYYEFDENNELGVKVPFDKQRIGLIAQDVEAVIPEAVINDADINMPKSIDYGGLVGLLVKAIQEQQAQIEELKQLINK